MTCPTAYRPCALAFFFVAFAFCAEPLKWEARSGYRVTAVTPAQPGKTGFTLLGAAQTGIRFTNLLSDTAAATNQNLMQGAGVAAGDFDGDGWCDLYFCNVIGRNSLYRNLGDFRFEDVTEKAGVACPGLLSTGAAFADLNGDGAPDLIVAGNNSVRLFFNQGNGQFTNGTAAAGINTKPLGATSIAVADLDGNGTLDVFIANYGEITILRSGGDVSYRFVNGKAVVSGRFARRWKIIGSKLFEYGEPCAVYLNDGKGHFTSLSWTDGRFLDEDSKPLKEPPMDLSLSVMLRDMNGDGAPDIYVSNDFQTPDRIWVNDGKGYFRALPRLAMRQQSHFSMGADFADIDRDGHDDFVVMDMLSRFHTLKMTQIIDTNLMTARPGDIDDRPQSRRNTMFWNRGDGTYAEIANFAGVEATDWSWTPAFVDVDLDGYEDLLTSNGHAFDTQDLDAGMKPQEKGPGAAERQLTHFPKLETPNCAFRNRRDRTFEEVGTQWGFNSKQVSHGIILADLDNDADADVIVSSLNAPALIYRNESAAPRILVRLKGKAPNVRGIGARIKVRGGPVPEQSQEIICGGRYLSADEPARMFAAGSATNRLTVEVTWRSGTRSVINDAVANGIYEIDEAGAVAPQSSVSKVQSSPPLFQDVGSLLAHKHHDEAFDDFVRQPLLSRKLSQLGPGVAWIDLDGDGRDELVIGGGRGGALSVLKSSRAGVFSKTEFTNCASDDLLGMTAWANGGKRSLLIARANYENGGAAALLSVTAMGSGFVVATQSVVLASSPGPLAVADMDSDGDLDVFIGTRVSPGRYPEASGSQVLRNENGRLVRDEENSRGLQSAGMVSGAAWSDLDGDGLPELILACEWSSPKIFRNDRGKLLSWNPRATGAAPDSQLSTLDHFTGWWASITTGDIDGDGKMDIIFGNWGLNSSYRATPHPQKLYHGQFSGDGSAQSIEAEFEPALNKFVPRENLTILAPAMPFLRAKFPTHTSFRLTSVQEFLGDRFKAAKEIQAATLATTMFLNRGDHFEAVPLPAEAQWAPTFGISVADADGDGNDDVFLAQNFFATRKEIPRLDGGRGLWLRNDGKGNLRPMAAEASGVSVWGEQRGCAAADFDEDGRVDLAVSQNAAPTRLFRNEKGKPGIRVRLKGTPENPDAIGAIVRLKYADGLGPAREVHGGSGYLSQDSTVSVLGLRGQPTHVVVRWPGGRTTEAPLAPGAKEAVVDLPK